MCAVPGALLGTGNGDDESVRKWLGSVSSLFTQAVLLHVLCGVYVSGISVPFPIN